MFRSLHIQSSTTATVLTGVPLAMLWLSFAVMHISAFMLTGALNLLVFCAAETLVAGFFLFRRPAKTFSLEPGEWCVAALGTFLPLLLKPTSMALVSGAEWGVSVGATIQIAGLLSLNRSFAIVPALREIKTGGMYRWVRHPIYASYLITLSAYVLSNYSLTNVLVWTATLSFLFLRIHLEERHLSQSPEYRGYMQRVRWRVVPLLY